jgi:putative ABC transport system substrate-binding protein
MRLARLTALATLALALLAAPHAGEAQQAGKVYRIGILGTAPPGSNPAAAHLSGVLLQGLQDLGYVEGRNLVIERRYPPEGKTEELPALAADLVRIKVDVIVAGGSLTPHAAKQATTTIPIVMPNHGDPVGSGLVASLARPGGNITGLSLLSLELVGKQLELLKASVPKVVRVIILWNPTSQTHARLLNEADVAARALGLRVQRLPARGLNDYERVFSATTQARADAALVLGDPIFFFHHPRIAELATTAGLPTMFAQREYAEAGGLMSYGADLRENYRRAAVYVDKILKGARPGDLPIEQPTKFELVINLKTAKALGLTIPPSVLARADEVIE